MPSEVPRVLLVALAAALAYLAVAWPPTTVEVAVAVGVALALGFAESVGRTMRLADVVQHGRRARAELLALRESGGWSSRDERLLRVEVRVQGSSVPAFTAAQRVEAPSWARALRPGVDPVVVAVDPARPERWLVDWQATHALLAAKRPQPEPRAAPEPELPVLDGRPARRRRARERMADRLRRSGRPATAELLALEPPGADGRRRLRVLVATADARPYEALVEDVVPEPLDERLRPGVTLRARVHRADAQRVAIDWGHEIAAAGAGAAAADGAHGSGPVAPAAASDRSAALRRAGGPPGG